MFKSIYGLARDGIRAIGSGLQKCGKLVVTGVATGAALVFGSEAAMAQATPIPLQEIDLDWSTFAGTLATALAAVIAVAIGVGIGVWMVRLLYRIFKSMARG
jgi:ABC-type proline/glycine betaine transport system permease subunit